MGSQNKDSSNNSTNKSAKHSSLKSKKTTNVNTKKTSQTHNTSGTKYSGKLADFMKERNKPTKESNLDKSVRRRLEAGINVVSPQDAAGVFGRYVDTDEAQERFGSKNKAAKAYSSLVDQQQDRLNNAIGGARFRDEYGQVRAAPDTFARGIFNQAAGFNETTGMGILDSIKHNYAMSQGIPGSGIVGAALSLASGIPGLGLVANPILDRFFPSQDEEGVNRFGMPEYDLRTINEYSTTPTYSPSIVDEEPSLSFNDDAFAAALDNPLAMRQMLPRNLNLPNQLRLTTNPQLRLPAPQLRLPAPKTNLSLTGLNLRPSGTTLSTAGSPFQNPNMLNQKLSKYGTVGNTSVQQAQPKFSMPANKYGNPLSFLGKRTIPGLLMSGLSAVSSLEQGQPEDGSTFSEALDNLSRPMFNYDGNAVNPVFDFDPLGFLDREESLNKGGSVAPQRGPMSSGIGTLYKLK